MLHGARCHPGKAVGGPESRADWLTVSTGRDGWRFGGGGGRASGRPRARTSGLCGSQLQVRGSCPGGSWASRWGTRGLRRSGGGEGAGPGRWALGGGAPLLGLPISGSRHLVRAASPSVLGTQRRPALSLLSSGKGSYSPTAVISQMLRFNRDIKIERLVRQGWLINRGFVI